MKSNIDKENHPDISYQDEEDRAYGLAGMAISIASLDAADRIAEVWLDAEGPMVSFSNDYFFAGSPSVSPKAVWNNLLRNFHLTASMAVGNVMARAIVRQGKSCIDSDVMDYLREVVVREAEETCSLEADEAENILYNCTSRANRIFFNPRVQPAVRELAGVLRTRRRLSGHDLEEVLSLLGL